MKRLHWFIIKNFLGPFFLTFFICIFILLMQFLWRYIDDLVGKGLEWQIIAEFLTYASFALVPMAFPLAMLLASIMAFGSMGENYELVAMKASGISLFRAMRPLIYIAVCLTGTAFFFSNNILPQTNLKFGALLASVKTQKPEMIIKEGVFANDIDKYSIKVDKKSRDSNMLYDLMIYDHTDNRGNVKVSIADSGTMVITHDKKYMILTLYNGENYEEQKEVERGPNKRYPFRRDRFTKQVINVPLKGFDFNRQDETIYRNYYRMMNLQQLRHQEDSLYEDYLLRLRRFVISMNYNSELVRSVINETQPVDSLKKALLFAPDTIVNIDTILYSKAQMFRNEIIQEAISEARSNAQNINHEQDMLYARKKDINKHTIERHKKFSWSFACLIFFFIGAPLGAIIRKGGLGMPVVVSILMFITYYMVSITGEKFAREDVWAMFNGMWFSSFIFLGLGIFLTYKAATDSAIMNMETYQLVFKKLVSFGFLKNKKNQQ
ncbi:MAG: LptF/LptG family permease [Prolixibacteraceae bacterium]|jgi:lipopolysaccharide export system permease protein|nr:LptF/LptG family permease [Prolixibacteraceae bacterium]